MENGWAGIILPAVLDVGKSMLGGPLNQHILSMGGGVGGSGSNHFIKIIMILNQRKHNITGFHLNISNWYYLILGLVDYNTIVFNFVATSLTFRKHHGC